MIVQTETTEMYAAFGKMHAERPEMHEETQNGAGNAYPAPRHSPAIDLYIIAQTARKRNTMCTRYTVTRSGTGLHLLSVRLDTYTLNDQSWRYILPIIHIYELDTMRPT